MYKQKTNIKHNKHIIILLTLNSRGIIFINRHNVNLHYLENNDCVTCVFMVLFRNQMLLFWSEEFVPRGEARGTIRMTKTTTDDFQTKP